MTAVTDQPMPTGAKILSPPPPIERVFDQAQLDQYGRDGAIVARRLFSADEVAGLRDHYMRLRAVGTYAGDSAGVPTARRPTR